MRPKPEVYTFRTLGEKPKDWKTHEITSCQGYWAVMIKRGDEFVPVNYRFGKTHRYHDDSTMPPYRYSSPVHLHKVYAENQQRKFAELFPSEEFVVVELGPKT